MRRIFKNVAFAITTLPLVAISCSISSCSCTFKTNEKPKLDSIDLKLPLIPSKVKEGESRITDSIQIKCYDQQGKTIKSDTKLLFTMQDGSPVPGWIWIDASNNSININGFGIPSIYQFKLIATSNDEKIKSSEKTFSIEIFEEPVVAPESIEILCDEITPTIMTTSTQKTILTVKPYKEGYPEELVCGECDWYVQKIEGKTDVDLAGNPLFNMVYDENGCEINLSENVDKTYVGDYVVTILAISILEPFTSNTIQINFHVIDGLEYYDEESMYTYTRPTINDTWELTKIYSGIASISNAKSEIYGVPVTKIADNFSSNSGMPKLMAVYLPDSYITIGAKAFYNQQTLYDLGMPGVKNIGQSAFEKCPKVSLKVTYEQPKLENIGARAFYGCKLFKLDVKQELFYLGDLAFFNTAITKIYLGENIVLIGNNCFDSCPNLTLINIETLDPPQLEGSLFESGTPLKTIEVPSNSIEIYKNFKSWSIYQDKIIGF